MNRRYRNYDLSKVRHAKYMDVKTPFTLYSLIATLLFVGRIRFMSGTFGSLVFYPIFYYTLSHYKSNDEATIFFSTVAIVLFAIALWAVAQYQKVTNSFDHYSVVVDELVGMSVLFACAFKMLDDISSVFYDSVDISSYNLNFLIGFVVFRFFDITKPLFIKHVDRYYKSAFGVILDDVLAAIMGAGFIFVVYMIMDKLNYF